ncbi:MAG TPA: YwqG family protein [Pirellulales bacterium]
MTRFGAASPAASQFYRICEILKKQDKPAMHPSDNLHDLSDRELVQAYIDVMVGFHATENVAKANRLAGYKNEIFREMRSRGRERPMLEELAQHPHEGVRSWAASNLKWLHNPPPPSPPPRPLRTELRWQTDRPPPPTMTSHDISDRLKEALPKFSDRIRHLALPAIGLWPQRLRDDIATASRLGGMPLAPHGWQWPMEDDEPLVFVGQINCHDLRGLPGADVLPSSGLLSFYAEHDGVMACRIEARTIAIHHWPDLDALVPAAPPIPPMVVPPPCPVVMRPVADLPHPHSGAIRRLKLSGEQLSDYAAVWNAIRNHGIPAGRERNCSFSKLLGWPALVQARDPDQFEFNHDPKKKICLLLQVDDYISGEAWHAWGPGGSLYFAVPEEDLLAQNFAACEFDIQFT